MSKQQLIDYTISTLKKLPQSKVHEVADFADFVLKRSEDRILQKGIETLISNSESFAFLNDEEELYSEADLQEKYWCTKS